MSRETFLTVVFLACAAATCRSQPATGPTGTASMQSAPSPAPAPLATPAPVPVPPAASTEIEDMGMPAAKRVGPSDVPPVTVGAVRFTVLHWGKERGLGQNGGYIVASDANGGTERWKLKVYDVTYDSKMEEDVQDVFIDKMTAGPGANELTIVDERGGEYRVDTSARRVRLVKPRR